jgi:hypothetical protein
MRLVEEADLMRVEMAEHQSLVEELKSSVRQQHDGKREMCLSVLSKMFAFVIQGCLTDAISPIGYGFKV